MINNEELKKILETIDVFKLITLKAEEEKREFARYSLIWGFIIFLIFIYYGFKLNFLGRISWLYIFLLGAFLSTINVSNLLISGITWIITGIITTTVFYISNNYLLFQIIFVILTFLSYSLNYAFKSKYKKDSFVPLKYSISSKIGITWGIISAGMGFVIISIFNYLSKISINIESIYIFILLFGFISSVGIFISGLVISGFFLVGIIGIFGIPILSIININLSIILASLIFLFASIYSGLIYFKKERKL
ncbi:MAG: hypothetical protein H5U37_01320 [Caldisericia bacterium]|nr:hypothetical protein [Caldisericia bacterium]